MTSCLHTWDLSRDEFCSQCGLDVASYASYVKQEQVERLIDQLGKLLTVFFELKDMREALELRVQNQLHLHTEWINKQMKSGAETMNEGFKKQREWVEERMESWRDGERQKIQLRQIEAAERMAAAIEKEAELHGETHSALRKES